MTLSTINLIAKNKRIKAKNLKTIGTKFFFAKNDLKREKRKVQNKVETSQPNSKNIKNKICPPMIFSLSKNACGTQIVIQKIQKPPLKIVKRNIFQKKNISLSPKLFNFPYLQSKPN